MKILSILLLLLPTLAWSIPEERYEQLWEQEVIPHFKNMDHGFLTNAQGLPIKYAFKLKDPEAKTLVIVPGRSEPTIKYAEVIYDLRFSEFNIFILDHQGQGESGRLLSNSDKGHVLRFQDYVNDFDQFMKEVVKKNASGDLYLIAHSMGGAITTRFMARNPALFKRAVLMAPMFQINTEPYAETVARYFAKLLVALRKGNSYAPGKGPYKPEEDLFEGNDYTHSSVRFEANKSLFTGNPHLVVGGPTSRWVHEALKATKHIHHVKIKTPILLFQSGLDNIVELPRQEKFCQNNFCKLAFIENGKHELLMEKDEIRNPILKKIESFFASKLFPEDRKSVIGY